MSETEKPIGLKVKEEQIDAQELPVVDCSMMDARSRKMLLYLIKAEKKRYKSYPQKWVAEPIQYLDNLETAIAACKRVRQKPVEDVTPP